MSMNAERKSYIYIPPSCKVAERHLKAALRKPLERLTKKEFMKAYCSVAYLFPGFHPDSWDEWEGPPEIKPLLGEAWRRAGEGELTDNELYPYQASKARIKPPKRGT